MKILPFRAGRSVLHLLAGTAFVLCAAIPAARAQQQDSTGMVQVETRDGNVYVGRIVGGDASHIRLETQRLGVITIPNADILRSTPIQPARIKENLYWFDNPQATRYLWSPNGFGLKKGEGYYQNIWVVFNQVSLGVSDYFSVGAGMIPAFLVNGGPTPVWFTPKFSIPVHDNFNIGLGGLFGTVLGESESGLGVLYGITTFGSRDRNLSLGVGYGYAGGSLARSPLISVSAMIRTGQRGYVLTENYYINAGDTNNVLLSFAGRRIIKRAGLDFGLMIPTGTGSFFVAIPWLGLTLPFGNKS